MTTMVSDQIMAQRQALKEMEQEKMALLTIESGSRYHFYNDNASGALLFVQQMDSFRKYQVCYHLHGDLCVESTGGIGLGNVSATWNVTDLGDVRVNSGRIVDDGNGRECVDLNMNTQIKDLNRFRKIMDGFGEVRSEYVTKAILESVSLIDIMSPWLIPDVCRSHFENFGRTQLKILNEIASAASCPVNEIYSMLKSRFCQYFSTQSGFKDYPLGMHQPSQWDYFDFVPEVSDVIFYARNPGGDGIILYSVSWNDINNKNSFCVQKISELPALPGVYGLFDKCRSGCPRSELLGHDLLADKIKCSIAGIKLRDESLEDACREHYDYYVHFRDI